MAEQFGDKSQEATPYRRERARQQGHVAKSHDLASAVLLMAALLILLHFGRQFVDFLGHLAQHQLGGPAWTRIDQDTAVAQWHLVIVGVGRAVWPLFGLMLLAAVLAHVGQVGFLFLPQKVAPDLSRVDPIKGFSRLFSLSNAVRVGFGIFKILVVGGVALGCLWRQRNEILTVGAMDVPQISAFVVEITLWTCLKIGAALLVLALFDYGYQRWKYEQDLRMTPQEVREELKQLQGDPHIIARRRAVQRQLALNRLSSTVPRADVVVTNPTELAIALKYDPEEMAAPVVIAKGAGVLAQRIRQLALENNIPVVERKELARVLFKEVEINQAIPAEQYTAVAEVLRYVYELNGEMPAALRSTA